MVNINNWSNNKPDPDHTKFYTKTKAYVGLRQTSRLLVKTNITVKRATTRVQLISADVQHHYCFEEWKRTHLVSPRTKPFLLRLYDMKKTDYMVITLAPKLDILFKRLDTNKRDGGIFKYLGSVIDKNGIESREIKKQDTKC